MADMESTALPPRTRDSPTGMLPWALFGIVIALRLASRKSIVGLDVEAILTVVAFILSGSTIGFNAAGTTPSPPDVLASLITAAVFVSGVRCDFGLSLELPVYAKLRNASGDARGEAESSCDARMLAARRKESWGDPLTWIESGDENRRPESGIGRSSERKLPRVHSTGSRRKKPSGR